jgi:DNA-binding Lrp family transcriptional regulator
VDVPAVLSCVSDGGNTRNGRSVEVETGRPARGRLFEPVAEAAMHATLRDLAQRLPGANQGLLLVPEFVGPYGVVDLLAVTYIGDRINRRWRSGIAPITSELDVQILSAIPASHGASLEEISQSLGRPAEAIRRRVRQLSASGALHLNGSAYSRDKALTPLGRLWALEAKVNDWRRGLGQAIQYGLWADASAVVLSRLSVDTEYLVKEAQRLNVGIALGSRWLVRPRIKTQSEMFKLWASELLFAALLTSPTLQRS